MGYEIVWTDGAGADLDAIRDHIATSSPETSQKVGDALVEHVEILKSFPSIGPSYPPGSNANRRQILYKKYRIFYRVLEERQRVEILGIWHGSRREPIDL